MKIVQVMESLEVGGLERLALDLALEHKRRGYEAAMYCVFRRGALAERAEEAGISVREFHKTPGFSLATLMQMTAAFREDRPDVVHTHNSGIHHYAAVAAKLAGVPRVINTRHSPGNSDGRAYRERYFRWVMPFTEKVIFVSEQTRTMLGECGVRPKRSAVIRNGVPTQIYRRHAAQPGVASPKIRFGTVGRMVPVKAHDVLLKAFKEVKSQLPAAELRIVGGGVLKERLVTQARDLGVEDSVSIEGTSSDIPQILSQFDIFVLSSLSEGLPLVILEAMAAGLPVVSTHVGGIPEVLKEEFSWMCAPGDHEALAAAMLKAAACDDLSRRGSAAAAFACRDYDFSTMYELYDTLFHGDDTRGVRSASMASGRIVER